MPQLTADAFTGGPAPAIHAGLNTQICSYSVTETASGSLTVALTPLPAGAEVVNVTFAQNNNALGTGAETISIFATIGGQTATPGSATYQFIASAAAGTTRVVRADWGNDLGKRITASANMYLQYGNLVGTGTASVDVKVIVEYLTRKRGD